MQKLFARIFTRLVVINLFIKLPITIDAYRLRPTIGNQSPCWWQLANRFVDTPRVRNVTECKVVRNGFVINFARYRITGRETLKLRTKVNPVCNGGIIKRLLTQPITNNRQFLFWSIPDCNGKHTI